MNKTGIAWCDYTWNPIIGCSPASEGCANCYAATMAARLEAMGQKDYAGLTRNGKWTGEIRCLPERLEEPLHKKKPSRIFVCSMSDLFHENVPLSFILRVFEVMASAKQHTFQVLTKRPERALYALRYGDKMRCESAEHHRLLCTMPLPNVWFGVTAENQDQLLKRWEYLREIPAAVRFVSVEPMLGPIVLPTASRKPVAPNFSWYGNAGIDWVICGGESGKNARPMDVAWARSLRDQCKAAGVSFFMKQMSGNTPIPADLQIREFPR